MSGRTLLSVATGVAAALALAGLYLGVVTLAQGADHALQLLWSDRGFVAAIGAGFGTQVGLFTYLRMLRSTLSGGSAALAGAGTTTSSVSMVACCAHHVADVLPVIGLSGLAVFLVEVRTPLMLLGLATNAVGVGVMIRDTRRVTALARAADAQAFA